MRTASWRWSVAGAALILGLAACVTQPQSTGFESHRASRSRTTLIPVPPGSVAILRIIGGVGNVTIRPWDRADKIQLEYVKMAYGASQKDAEEELDDVAFDFLVDGAQITINTVQQQPNTPQRSNGVDLVLDVPPTITLDVFAATGDVSIEGVRSPGGLKITSMTGDVTLVGVDAPERAAISARAGSATFAGSIGASGDYALNATIGNLTVTLPTGTSARLDAETTLGAITARGVALDDEFRRAQGGGNILRGIMGAGGPPLTLRNQMGDIVIAVGE
jgi:DUF4097 and DUF4098 domain-containing protein YvlB